MYELVWDPTLKNYEQSGLKFLQDMIPEEEAWNKEELRKLVTRHPDLLESLKKLASPSVSNRDFSEIMESFNNSHPYKKEGFRQQIRIFTSGEKILYT